MLFEHKKHTGDTGRVSDDWKDLLANQIQGPEVTVVCMLNKHTQPLHCQY